MQQMTKGIIQRHHASPLQQLWQLAIAAHSANTPPTTALLHTRPRLPTQYSAVCLHFLCSTQAAALSVLRVCAALTVGHTRM